MKKYILYIAALFSTNTLLNSCDFLDVVPPEQAVLTDAMKDAEATLGFLYSCYNGIWNPLNYICAEASTDEFVIPALWDYGSTKISYDLYTPEVNLDWRWSKCYESIAQTNLFLREIENAKGCSMEQIEEWKAEAYFLLAYYHFEVLRFHGPIPIVEEYIDRNLPKDEFPGRMHYDYVTNWIIDLLDNKVISNPYIPMDRPSEEKGRATKLIAYALKSRVLLYAASPLWNGEFPYPNWKNKLETPGYGQELVSCEYSRKKWEDALSASLEALEKAKSIGIDLYNDMKHYQDQNVDLNDVYIPGLDQTTLTEEDKNYFREKVLMLRYMITAQYNEGNTELIWGLNDYSDNIHNAIMPKRVHKMPNGDYFDGYSGLSPTLNTVESFYTINGKLPSEDAFFNKDYFSRANVSESRPDIINLNVNREPRFYAWLSFDQGDYGINMSNGSPLIIQLKDGQKQGYNPILFNRNQNITGYFCQKWIRPNQIMTDSYWNVSTADRFHRPLIRVAELYLNIAECYAALGDKDNSVKYLDYVRDRAGIAKLTDIGLGNISIMDWVRNERFIELWGEGHRYFDLRRWCIADKYLSAGKRCGLNAISKVNPSFEEFNTPVVINEPFRWSSRMYIAPINYSEIIKNTNLVQAPGY